MKFTNLFSSSRGNSLLVESENTKILVDAGLPGSTIVNELKKIDVEISDIDAILITHEHSDHIKGAGVLSRRADIPIYLHRAACDTVLKKVGRVKEENIYRIEEEIPFYINDVLVNSFSIPHDAVAPIGFTIDDGKTKCGVATDMGMIMEDVIENLKECKFVFLEANHDENMLKKGSYPIHLKQRILSPFGHLSNNDSGKVLSELIKGKTERVRLGHLSEENNISTIAYETVKNVALDSDIKEGKDYILDVANRIGINGILEF
ncbi:MBL fold metallo-hydrolase [Anaerofustis stercorihominis]|uniref:MBL fold metallo-hydrolase n=1 Tax=Anaerofustis stercorihominis TaxID=214853 RepID=A0A3E3DVH4_9FIRM|nr:MBL fold metallo-hydrolase [Anaerofustis stercorihominis]RGD73250.1 MBL fold metallo-hydrolase [Anaerofustis stercorihominis]